MTASTEVFAELGLRATRVEDLLVAASVSRRTFYKHFRNKDEVLAALYDVATAQLLALVAREGATLDDIRLGLDAYLEYHRTQPKLLAVLVQEAVRRDSVLAPLRRRFRDQLSESLAAATQREHGERPDPLLFEALLGALESVSLRLIERRVTAKQVDRAKAVMHTILDRVLG